MDAGYRVFSGRFFAPDFLPCQNGFIPYQNNVTIYKLSAVIQLSGSTNVTRTRIIGYTSSVFLALFVIVLPVSGYTVAIYGTNAGFYPDLHPGSVEIIRSVPGSAGADLDANVDVFTQDSVDVIILGGQDTFSPSTAAKIEAAVAGGKILVVDVPLQPWI